MNHSEYPLRKPCIRTREIMEVLHDLIGAGEAVVWGTLGWSNWRVGLEFYGEGGRWSQGRGPHPAPHLAPPGDLLADAVERMGIPAEGAEVVVLVIPRSCQHEAREEED